MVTLPTDCQMLESLFPPYTEVVADFNCTVGSLLAAVASGSGMPASRTNRMSKLDKTFLNCAFTVSLLYE
ncbi:hypothetical protein D3C73_1604550 [compost metagenome]